MPQNYASTLIDSQIGFASISAFLCSLLSCYLLRPFALAYGLVDRPGGRKIHEDQVPLVGGIAMYLGLIIASVFVAQNPVMHPAFWFALTLLVGTGLVDSKYDIRAWKKICCQTIAGFMMVSWGQTSIDSFGHILGGEAIQLDALAPLVTVFCIVGVINAVNMIDGMDGLAFGVTLVALLGFALAGRHLSQFHLIAILLISSSVFGFWLLNMRLPPRKKAAVFMGDAGSMMLGFIIAWLAVELSQGEVQAIRPVSALWLIGLPLMDTVRLLLTRAVKGKHPFSADNEHLHHILLRNGCSHTQTVWVMLGLAALLATIGVLGERAQISEQMMFSGFIAVFASYSVVTTLMRQQTNAVQLKSQI